MEIEVKVRIKNEKRIKKQLNRLGAVFKEITTNIDHYFTTKHRDFMRTKECLRIRTIPEYGVSILTYKPPTTEEMLKEGMVWKDELEVELSDGKVFEDILKYLDCDKLVTVCKTRERFKLDGFTIYLDKLEGVGCFMEIEKISKDLASIKKSIWGVLEKLRISKGDIETLNYRDLTMQALDKAKKTQLGGAKNEKN